MTTIGPGTRVWCIKTSPWDHYRGEAPPANAPVAGCIYVVEWAETDDFGYDYLKLEGIGDYPDGSAGVWLAECFRPIDDAPGETIETGKELENA